MAGKQDIRGLVNQRTLINLFTKFSVKRPACSITDVGENAQFPCGPFSVNRKGDVKYVASISAHQTYQEFSNSTQPKKTAHWAIFWKLFSFTAHGPLMRIKIVVHKFGRYSEAVLVMCIAAWTGLATPQLWIKQVTSKQTLDKKFRKSVRSGRTSEFIKAKYLGRMLQDGPHTCLLWYSSQSANFQSFLRIAPVLIENRISITAALGAVSEIPGTYIPEMYICLCINLVFICISVTSLSDECTERL